MPCPSSIITTVGTIFLKQSIGCGTDQLTMLGSVSGARSPFGSLPTRSTGERRNARAEAGRRCIPDSAIEAMLTLGAVYHLRLRQTYGFTKSVFELLGLDLPVASVATLCRRRKALTIEPWVRATSEPLDLILDSTGLKIYGQANGTGPSMARNVVAGRNFTSASMRRAA